MTNLSPQHPPSQPSGLSAVDRDELALCALKRMKPFESKVLCLIYGLYDPLKAADGSCHSIAKAAVVCKCSEEKITRVLGEALAKLAATLDLEPVQAGRHLFRIGTHWSRDRAARSEPVVEEPTTLATRPSDDSQSSGAGVPAENETPDGAGR